VGYTKDANFDRIETISINLSTEWLLIDLKLIKRNQHYYRLPEKFPVYLKSIVF
jgi:hypothetical protein